MSAERSRRDVQLDAAARCLARVEVIVDGGGIAAMWFGPPTTGGTRQGFS